MVQDSMCTVYMYLGIFRSEFIFERHTKFRQRYFHETETDQ